MSQFWPGSCASGRSGGDGGRGCADDGHAAVKNKCVTTSSIDGQNSNGEKMVLKVSSF